MSIRLTVKEIAAVTFIANNTYASMGGECAADITNDNFSWFFPKDLAKGCDWTINQASGIIGSLLEKGLISSEENEDKKESGTVHALTDLGIAAVAEIEAGTHQVDDGLFKNAEINAFVNEICDRTERIQLILVLEYFTGKLNMKATTKQVQEKLAAMCLDEESVYEEFTVDFDEDILKVNELNHAMLIMKLADMCEEKIKSGPKRAIRKGGKSHAEKLVDYFGENNSATREYLEELLQTDSRNVNVAVSILRNPKRTKNPLNVQYNRATKMFILED